MSTSPSIVYDADSHLLELPGWLREFAVASVRERLGDLVLSKAGGAASEMLARAAARVPDPTAIVDGAAVLGGEKGWLAPGAFDPAERSRVLDVLGFAGQLVFTTFAQLQFSGERDPDVFYGAVDAHNRGIAAFCAADPRLLGVGFVSLRDPERALRALDTAIATGVAAVQVPSTAAGGVSPGHLRNETFWSRLAGAGLPLMIHLGGGDHLLRAPWHETGRPKPPDFVGGGENMRAKDFSSIHHQAETFLSALVLDGVFERHPSLRCGVIELGAGWVPSLLQRLDHAVDAFGRNEPLLKELSLRPSAYLRRQVRFTPFAFEDVGALIELAGPELFLFSTDYPHPEGTRDPMGKFAAALDAHAIPQDARDRFHATNFELLMGIG